MGVIIIVPRLTLKKGKDAEGEKTEDARQQAEATLKAPTDVDQFAHEAMYRKMRAA